jgi:hypothetical protein
MSLIMNSQIVENITTFGPYLVPINGTIVFEPPEILPPQHILEKWSKTTPQIVENIATFGPYLVPVNGTIVFDPPEILPPQHILEKWSKTRNKRR